MRNEKEVKAGAKTQTEPARRRGGKKASNNFRCKDAGLKKPAFMLLLRFLRKRKVNFIQEEFLLQKARDRTQLPR